MFCLLPILIEFKPLILNPKIVLELPNSLVEVLRDLFLELFRISTMSSAFWDFDDWIDEKKNILGIFFQETVSNVFFKANDL